MNYPFTAVSAFYFIKNKHNNLYLEWFKNTLTINCPYVFFCDKNSIDIIKKYRTDIPTYYIECNIEDFNTYKYKNRMITHPIHCPSIELNIIWNEKIFLINKASKINPFNSYFFGWIDAGHCTYRDIKPPIISFPNVDKLNKLPTDKFIFTSSDSHIYQPQKINSYYHFISGTYIIHINFINFFTQIYDAYLNDRLDHNNIYTDQVILTLIYHENPFLFHHFAHGYGTIIPLLY